MLSGFKDTSSFVRYTHVSHERHTVNTTIFFEICCFSSVNQPAIEEYIDSVTQQYILPVFPYSTTNLSYNFIYSPYFI